MTKKGSLDFLLLIYYIESRRRLRNTLKAVLESYRFQTFGEYSALLSTLNIEARQVRGDYMGTPYTGII